MSRLLLIRIALWLAVIIASLIVWLFIQAPRTAREINADLGHGDYTLMTTDGQPFTKERLIGHPSLIFFGFTNCPEVCPTTLGDISIWQRELGAKAEELQIFFITVDPERDTVQLLKDYLGWLDHTYGVTGSLEDLAKAAKSFGVYYQKVPLEDGDYSMDHSANTLLFDEAGNFFGVIGYNEDFDRAIAELKRLLE